jgi:methionyl-tRNA formyltransferase
MTKKNKKNVVMLCSKKIGLECLKILFSKQEDFSFKILGVLTNERGKEIKDFCNSNNLRLIRDLQEYQTVENVDIAISVQYHKILKQDDIDVASQLTVNLHMAPVPEYRGCNQFSFAIINKENYFGTTLHVIDAGVDSGDILFERRFPISENINVETLYNQTFNESVILFEDNLHYIINGKYSPKKQELTSDRKQYFYKRKDIEDIKKIDLSWSKEKINRYLRATSMPGFDPPYTILNGKKTPLTLDLINEKK